MEGTQSKSTEAITLKELLRQANESVFTVRELEEFFDRTPITSVRLAIINRLKTDDVKILSETDTLQNWLIDRISQFEQEEEWKILVALFRCACNTYSPFNTESAIFKFSAAMMDRMVHVLDSALDKMPDEEYRDLLVIFCGRIVHTSVHYNNRIRDYFRKILDLNWEDKKAVGLIKRVLRIIGTLKDTTFLPLLREKGYDIYKLNSLFDSSYMEPEREMIEVEGWRLAVIRRLECFVK